MGTTWVSKLRFSISDFAITVIRHHDQKQLIEGRVCLGFHSRGTRVCPVWEAWQPESIEQRAHIHNSKHGAERANSLNLQSPPLVASFLQQDHISFIYPNGVTRNHAFKHLNLWRTFLFKSPHTHSGSLGQTLMEDPERSSLSQKPKHKLLCLNRTIT